MASIKRDTTISECQNFTREVYGLNNDRYFNIEDTNMAEELSIMFSQNCHVCKKAPCQCDFADIMGFKS